MHYIELSKGFRFGLSGFFGAILGAVLGFAIFLLFVGLPSTEDPEPETAIPIDTVCVKDLKPPGEKVYVRFGSATAGLIHTAAGGPLTTGIPRVNRAGWAA